MDPREVGSHGAGGYRDSGLGVGNSRWESGPYTGVSGPDPVLDTTSRVTGEEWVGFSLGYHGFGSSPNSRWVRPVICPDGSTHWVGTSLH